MVTENKHFILDRPRQGFRSFLRYVVFFILAILYKFIMGFIHCAPEEKKYNVSICGIFKNEAKYLKEWIEFNHIVGIEHFYLYNNNSDDNFIDVLQPYIKIGWVTLIDWPYKQQQMEAYINCIKKFSSETKWIGFIDIDEFIVPKSTDRIYDFLRNFEENRGAVTIYWRLYGSSGHVSRNDENLVIENFTVCWPKYCDVGKCFYNTAFEFNEKSKHVRELHHKFWANWKGKDIPPVNIFDKVSIGCYNAAKVSDFPIQINHYFTKSYKEYAMKKAKGDVYFKNNPHDEEYFYQHEMKCTSTDYSAYKYLIKLKLALKIAL